MLSLLKNWNEKFVSFPYQISPKYVGTTYGYMEASFHGLMYTMLDCGSVWPKLT
jgi:hypothetical protein